MPEQINTSTFTGEDADEALETPSTEVTATESVEAEVEA
jgi:hypothetical protein